MTASLHPTSTSSLVELQHKATWSSSSQLPAQCDSVATAGASRPLPITLRDNQARRQTRGWRDRRDALHCGWSGGMKGVSHASLRAPFVVNGPLSELPCFGWR